MKTTWTKFDLEKKNMGKKSLGVRKVT